MGQFYLTGNKNLRKINIEITDVTGRLIFTGICETEKLLINLNDKSKGFYFIKAYLDKAIFFTAKIVVE